MRTTLTAILLFSLPASADNEISIGQHTRALRTDSANALTSDSLTGGALGYARGSGIEVIPDLELWGIATFSWGDAEGSMFQTLSTELDALAFSAGARARYAWRPRIVASGRFEIGLHRAAVALRDGAGHTASDAGWGAITMAAVGVDLYAIYRPRFSLGFRAELGAVATSSIPLTATPESGSEGTLQLEMTAASLGSLNLTGTMFAAAVVSQF